MNKWISVEDKLPKSGQKVLVYINKHGEPLKQQTAIYERWSVYIDGVESNSGYDFSFVLQELQGYITHWQPLPSPPCKP